jgi:GntR family histidine utilization transcriptional repressor
LALNADATRTVEAERDGRLAYLILDGEGPLWLQIRRAIARPILSGAWGPGSRVPAELALTEWFQTARMTVAKAMQSLANEGLVERRRKIGTVVSARAGERPVFEIWDTAEVVHRRGAAYGYKLLSCAFVGDSPEDRALLGVERSVQIIRMTCLHTADGRPFQVEDRLINVDAAPQITCQPLETMGPGPWLIAHVPWTQAEHVISAHSADDRLADLLDVAEGAACLLVERRTWNGDQPVTLARLWHSGAEHRLVGRFEPSAQPA